MRDKTNDKLTQGSRYLEIFAATTQETNEPDPADCAWDCRVRERERNLRTSDYQKPLPDSAGHDGTLYMTTNPCSVEKRQDMNAMAALKSLPPLIAIPTAAKLVGRVPGRRDGRLAHQASRRPGLHRDSSAPRTHLERRQWKRGGLMANSNRRRVPGVTVYRRGKKWSYTIYAEMLDVEQEAFGPAYPAAGWLFVWENGQRPHPNTVTGTFNRLVDATGSRTQDS